MIMQSQEECLLLDDSQATEEDRRETRCLEREFFHQVKRHEHELSNISLDAFQDKALELKELYKRVYYPREANLDATNLDEISVIVGKQAEKLTASDLGKFDPDTFIQCSRKKCSIEGSNSFDWSTLGKATGVCFQSIPDIKFLYGSMNTEVTVREKRSRRVAIAPDNSKEACPKDYRGFQKERQDAQARRLKRMQNTLEDAAEHGQPKVDFFELVTNSESFTQTVENLFDLSFLVRHGEVAIEKSQDGLLSVESREDNGMDELPTSKQCIVEITPENWKV